MISYELWLDDQMFDVAINRELPRVGERITCSKGLCKVKRVFYVLNQVPKIYLERII